MFGTAHIHGTMTPSAPCPRVLVIDDEESIRDPVAEKLARRGYDVAAVPDADEALFYLAQQAVDVVILDIRMPGTDGLELLPRIKAGFPGTAVIVASGIADPDGAIASKVKGMGAFAFLKKPFRLGDLTQLLEMALGETPAGLGGMAPCDDRTAGNSVAVAPRDNRPKDEARPAQSCNVLLVSDERAAANVLSEGLAGEGHRVTRARDASGAVSCLGGRPFDVIILDLRVPQEEALSALDTIGRRCSQATLIVLTAATARAGITKPKAEEMGALALPRKPIPLAQIKRSIREHVAGLGASDGSDFAEEDPSPDGSGRRARRGRASHHEDASEMKQTVLVVDGHGPSRESATQALRGKGYHVGGVASGEEALLWRSQNGCDVLVMEIRLPGMDGFELLRRLRQNYPEDVIIVLTGAADPMGDLKDEATALGADAFLRKPFRIWEFEQAFDLGESDRLRRSRYLPDDEGESLWDVQDQQYSLLIVDDEIPLLRALKKGLSIKGFDVSIAGDASEALALQKVREFDAMLIDVRMPGTDGIELLRQLKAHDPDVFAVVLTALADHQHGLEYEALKAGAHSLLRKPIGIKELNRHLREALWLGPTSVAGGPPDGVATDRKSPLPQGAALARAPAAMPSRSAEGVQGLMAGRAVLVLDNDQQVLDSVAEELVRCGCYVVTARQADDAVSYRAQRAFDAIVFNLDIPGADVLEVIRKLKFSHPDAVSILLTESTDPPRVLRKAVEAFGARAVLRKPLRMQELLGHLGECVGDVDRAAVELGHVQRGRRRDLAGAGEGVRIVAKRSRFRRKTEGQHTVLVADEEEPVLDAIVEFLTDRGYDVVTARDGAEALAGQWREKCDAALIDIRMPIIGGMDALGRLKGKYPDLVVIMMSDEQDRGRKTRSRATELGAYAVLDKPLDLDRLVQIIGEALGSNVEATGIDSSIEKKLALPPALAGVTEAGPPPLPVRSDASLNHSAVSVLMVCSDLSSTEEISVAMAAQGYTSTTVKDTDEAMFYLLQQAVPAVVVDATPPKETALEFVREAKALLPGTLVICFSRTKTNGSLKNKALEAGADGLVSLDEGVTGISRSIFERLAEGNGTDGQADPGFRMPEQYQTHQSSVPGIIDDL